MVDATPEQVSAMRATLLDEAASAPARTRALFTLLALPLTTAATAAMCDALRVDSELLAHEAAYCLGQRGDGAAAAPLAAVLRDRSLPVMVRHESGEALGALARTTPAVREAAVAALRECGGDEETRVVRETCKLALDGVDHAADWPAADQAAGPHSSVDPAPAAESIDGAGAVLADPSQSLVRRQLILEVPCKLFVFATVLTGCVFRCLYLALFALFLFLCLSVYLSLSLSPSPPASLVSGYASSLPLS